MFHNIKNFFLGNVKVLMYHRIAAPETDIWQLSVNPQKFEDQLKILQKNGNVVPIQQIVQNFYSKKLQKNCSAITFDDGYVDNYEIAKPLLEKYELPATFFISSGNIGTDGEYWWDELERLILFTIQLPSIFILLINEITIQSDLSSETVLNDDIKQKHRNWDAINQSPPTLRAQLFLRLWQELKPLSHEKQQYLLLMIRNWANIVDLGRDEYKTVSVEQLKNLSEHPLFTIGAHTVTHPALTYHNRDVQNREIFDNKIQLEKITGAEVDLLAYPYGNYNDKVMQLANEIGFKAAFTTNPKRIAAYNNPYELGRFQVTNFT